MSFTMNLLQFRLNDYMYDLFIFLMNLEIDIYLSLMNAILIIVQLVNDLVRQNFIFIKFLLLVVANHTQLSLCLTSQFGRIHIG